MSESEDAHQQARGNSRYKTVNSHVNFPGQSNRKSSLLYCFFTFTISISSSTISFFFFSGKKDPMFEFGDEFTIESYRIPWLIWIQILIFFLLIFLFSFSVFTSDPSQSHYNTKTPSSATFPSPSPSSLASVSAVSNSNKPLLNHSTTTTVANRLQHNQVGESQSIKGEIATGTSRRIVTEENTESQCISASSIPHLHLCNYFRLAKLAFLKCLGLDTSSDNSTSCDRKKER